MNFSGFLVGLFAFLIIGVFHPIVIKCEYYFTSKVWPVFLLSGLLFLALSLLPRQTIFSSALSILGITCLWSIGELKEQQERVKKGWFPANPKHRQ